MKYRKMDKDERVVAVFAIAWMAFMGFIMMLALYHG